MFKVNVFYRVLDIIITDQLGRRFPRLNEFMEKAKQFVKLYKKDFRLPNKFSVFDSLLDTRLIRELTDLLTIKNH